MRTLLSTIIGESLTLRKPTALEQQEIGPQHSQTLIVADSTGKCVAMIEVDDIFDHEGNRFEVDIDL